MYPFLNFEYSKKAGIISLIVVDVYPPYWPILGLQVIYHFCTNFMALLFEMRNQENEHLCSKFLTSFGI